MGQSLLTLCCRGRLTPICIYTLYQNISHSCPYYLTTMSTGTTYKLNNGVNIPAVGFGTFASEGAKGESYKAVQVALKTGYRHLDCAWFYQNECEVGEAIRDFLKENPSVKREDIFICTKVWNHLHEPEEVKWSLNNSLENFGLDYIDLFLVHWPIAAEKDDKNMPKLNEKGQYVIKDELVKFCFDNDIMPAAYSPLGSQNQVPTTGEKVNTNPTLNAIAEKGGNSLAQVLIAWGLRRGYVVLPKSSTPSRIESNFKIPQLTDEDFNAVNEVAKGRHTRFVNMKDTFGYDVWPEEAGTDAAAASS